MKPQKILVVSALVSILSLPAGVVLAADQTRDQEQTRTQMQDKIYGRQFMTEQERTEYLAKIRAAKTAEEQQQIREEHRERMKKRTNKRGQTLPLDFPVIEFPGGGGTGTGGNR